MKQQIEKSWGSYSVEDECWTHKVKILTVLPGKSTSYHFHSQRSEILFVLDGHAEIITGSKREVYHRHNVVVIHSGVQHQITNIANVPLEILEISAGISSPEALAEEDIVRIMEERIYINNIHKMISDSNRVSPRTTPIHPFVNIEKGQDGNQ